MHARGFHWIGTVRNADYPAEYDVLYCRICRRKGRRIEVKSFCKVPGKLEIIQG